MTTLKCEKCGKETAFFNIHHEPPQSEGWQPGDKLIVLCKHCHIDHHSKAGDFVKWGQIGGKKTAQNPENWMKNLKQFKAVK